MSNTQDKAAAFKAELDSLTAKKRASACTKLVKGLVKEYKGTTARAYLTKYRAAIKNTYPELLHKLTIPKAVQAKIQKLDNKKVAQKNRQQAAIFNHKSMIEAAIKLLGSGHVGRTCAALCLLTGRRMTEIMKTAKFTNCNNNSNTVYFKGQLKQDNADLKYKIYTLADRAKIKAALKFIRQTADCRKMTAAQVDAKYNNTVNTYVKREFAKYIGGGRSSHDLRRCYAAIIADRYKPADKSVSAFYAEILGHGLDDVGTALRYQSFYIKS